MTANIHIFDTPEETARGVAEVILLKAKEKEKLSKPFNIALSGGNTPKLLFKLLVEEYSEIFPWYIIRFFWVDERCVPPTHPDSNFGMTYETLLKNVPVPDKNIFRIIGEADPQKESIRYQQLIENQISIKNSIPEFDLILLGMGDDGHTASIFPTNLSLLYSEQFVAVATQPATGQKRITLTGTILNQAEEIIFLITGASKAEVLCEIFQRKPTFKNYPTAYIHAHSIPAKFYLDKSAASKL
jgi:6-phosphogluconolactonase